MGYWEFRQYTLQNRVRLFSSPYGYRGLCKDLFDLLGLTTKHTAIHAYGRQRFKDKGSGYQ